VLSLGETPPRDWLLRLALPQMIRELELVWDMPPSIGAEAPPNLGSSC
jgi:hypothetical protein